MGINKKVLIEGAVYVVASNEIMINMGSSAKGYNYFERDIMQIGLGYCISDYITLETIYQYTINLRTNDSILYINTIQLTLAFNNLFTANYLQGYFIKKTK